MQLITGDLWEEVGKADLLFVTTNGVVTKADELVMGRGCAREAKERLSSLPRTLALAKQSGKPAGAPWIYLYWCLSGDVPGRDPHLCAPDQAGLETA